MDRVGKLIASGRFGADAPPTCSNTHRHNAAGPRVKEIKVTTALQDRKLDRSFAHLDVNGNGQVERDDVLGLGARLLVGFGESPTSKRGRSVIDKFDALWDSLVSALDTDGDGRISPEEYRAGMTRAFIEGPDFERVFRPAAESIAQLADTDGDGSIDFAEFTRILDAFGASAGDAHAAFNRLDRDSSGTLTVAELVQATREYYTSDDPNAVGNWLFGPIDE